MKLFLLFFTLVCVKDSEAQNKFHHVQLSACSETDKEFMVGDDGEVEVYADFEKKKDLVYVFPPFSDQIQYPAGFGAAKSQVAVCLSDIEVFSEEFKDTPLPHDAPQTSIYPRTGMKLGSENTLICHSTRFFPPPVRVRWTKNNLDVTDNSSLSQYYPNEDHTYNQFSHLTFTPQEGDVYTCTVEHEALQTPDTRTRRWMLNSPVWVLLCSVEWVWL
ncbi:hypothetical protein AMELA_G00284820 [Ameiurus melas]|uniref:Ig-like domain-containing protein n=1 Tax=Ameiurus melas TaxID=219545 RepID=A0A7J5ZMD7_AMEME|nr:hypothetical protein AMELA_G00284820 [Ameiurus melas]